MYKFPMAGLGLMPRAAGFGLLLVLGAATGAAAEPAERGPARPTYSLAEDNRTERQAEDAARFGAWTGVITTAPDAAAPGQNRMPSSSEPKLQRASRRHGHSSQPSPPAPLQADGLRRAAFSTDKGM